MTIKRLWKIIIFELLHSQGTVTTWSLREGTWIYFVRTKKDYIYKFYIDGVRVPFIKYLGETI